MEKKIKVIRPLSELHNTKPKLKVCAYCRVSTEQEGQNGSYETQKAYYEQYIKSNPEWEFAGVYADKGTGMNTKNRNAFNEMLEDCENNKIDLIMCKSISRFARNTLDTIKIARELKDNGIYIIFEKENINTEKTESELAFNLLASFAQMESESISKNVKQGKRNRYKNGKCAIVKAPYGYIKDSKTEMSVNEEEAEVVRLIFKMYIDGYSAKKIINYLNENELGCNKKWNEGAITNRMIKNKIYIGTMVLQKFVNIEPKKMVTNKGYAPMYEIENHHEAIVSNEDFEKANEVLNMRIKKLGLDRQKKRTYTVFSGKMICSNCGSTLEICDNKNYRNISYVCGEVGCRKSKVTKNFIKEKFIDLRNELVKNYDSLIISNEPVDISYRSEDNEENIKKLNELTRQKEIMYRLKDDNIIDSAIFIEKNNRIDTDIANIKEEISKLGFNNTDKERKKLIKYIKKISETNRIVDVFQDDEFENIIDKIYIKNDIVTYVIKTGIEFKYVNNYQITNGAKYGYIKINEDYIVNEYEKDIIKYIFNEYASGKSVKTIIKSLSEMGIKTKKGKSEWDVSTIFNCLKNKEYLGDDKHQKIIEEIQFAKVQKIIKARKKGGHAKYE